MNEMNEKVVIPELAQWLPALIGNAKQRDELQAMIGAALDIALTAHQFQVTDVASYELAADHRKVCRKAAQKADAFRLTWVGPLNATVKRFNAYFKPHMDNLTVGADIYESKLLAYDREQRRLEEKARRKAEMDAANEKERLQREAERTATQLERKGEPEAAAEIRQSVPVVPVVAAYIAPPRPQGTSVVTTHKAQCTDLQALIKAAAAGTAPLTLLMVDASAMNKFAAATKGTIALPGVRFYIEESVRQRESAKEKA
ncbi:MAG: hypothetical protein ACYDCJ_12845 [Gammaproteobacteria bacterium]